MHYSRRETEVFCTLSRTKTPGSPASRPRCPQQPRILEEKEAALEEDDEDEDGEDGEDGEEVILSPPSSTHKVFLQLAVSWER